MKREKHFDRIRKKNGYCRAVRKEHYRNLWNRCNQMYWLLPKMPMLRLYNIIERVEKSPRRLKCFLQDVIRTRIFTTDIATLNQLQSTVFFSKT
jgi:hypothetical protein